MAEGLESAIVSIIYGISVAVKQPARVGGVAQKWPFLPVNA
jgi:hypothetical protein